jgi:hypothetical protein
MSFEINNLNTKGKFSIINTGSNIDNTIQFLTIGGGGGGGYYGGGGGGAGGFATGALTNNSSTPLLISNVLGKTYTVDVGLGGYGGNSTALYNNGGTGGLSAISGPDLLAYSAWASGGGYGAYGYARGPGGAGASGGGAAGGDPGDNLTEGAATGYAPGYAGGGGSYYHFLGGGGGGANSLPVPGYVSGLDVFAGVGGTGRTSNITGFNSYYAAGGSGGNANNINAPIVTMPGGGNAGNATIIATAGANFGSGGGGGGVPGDGGGGANGIVVLKYHASYPEASASVTSRILNNYRIYIFTSSGSITF